MNQNSLSEYYLFLNDQIIYQEKMLEYHFQAESQFKVLLESNLSRYSYSVLHNYLDGINDNIIRARFLNETVLNQLLRIVALMEPPKTPGAVH